MLPYNDVAMRQLEQAGIPIFISDPTDPTPTPRSNTIVVEYIQFTQYYNDLIKQRLADLPTTKGRRLCGNGGNHIGRSFRPPYTKPVGINIAENMTVYAPLMSAEFVVEQNPQVIIRMINSPTHNLNDFIQMREEIMNRPELQDVDAIKNGRVYICDWKVRNGIISVVGYLYFAK